MFKRVIERKVFVTWTILSIVATISVGFLFTYSGPESSFSPSDGAGVIYYDSEGNPVGQTDSGKFVVAASEPAMSAEDVSGARLALKNALVLVGIVIALVFVSAIVYVLMHRMGNASLKRIK